MRIISIDPGYERLGIAIIEKEKGSKETILFSECFQTDKKEPHERRLFLLGTEIRDVIEKWQPKALAIENLFLTNNKTTAMHVAETRGVILYEAARRDLPCFEYTPPQIKAAVTGNGHADKKAMMKMIPLLVKISKEIKHDDEFDAIAVGLTYFAMAR